MPFVKSDGARIHYEVEGVGPPLVLQHGFAGSLEGWRDVGYVDGLRGSYQLILTDARGHGASDKPHDSDAYSMRLKVSDVLAVLDDMSIERAHYWGYSMGAVMGWWAAIHAPERLRSLILGGRTPCGEGDTPLTPAGIQQLRGRVESSVRAPETQMGKWATVFPALAARKRKNDVEALVASRLRDKPSQRVYHPTALKEVLPWLEMPCPSLIYVGQEDVEQLGLGGNYLNCVKNMPNVTFVELPGLGHLDAFCRIDLVLPHVREFLAEVGEA